jgi:hypothetical protein
MNMTMTEHSILPGNKILLGDEKRYGWLRLAFLVVIPIFLSILISKVPLLRPLRFAYLQLLVIYYLGSLSAMAASVAYIQDIFGLDSDRMPFRHFISSFLGVGVPKIHIANRIHESDWKDMVEVIGGPAVLNIDPGYAVLTETLTFPANLYGQGGGYFISRHERVQEIIDLHEQEGDGKDLKATTRDGITVIVENLKYNYRLWDPMWEADPTIQVDLLNPYPFSMDAVRDFVYNRTIAVDDQGRPKKFDWRGAVGGRVQGIIKDYISERRLDDVIATHEHLNQNPRQEIRDKAYLPDFKKNLRGMGTVLRWWDPGEFKSPEPIEGQFLSDWSVDITSNIQINEAYGHAQKQAYEELGRAEAEAELLISIIHSLQDIRFGDDKSQTLQNLILIRTAQVIRALNVSTQEDASLHTNHSTLHPTNENK